jgi:hypothetical protein
MTASASGRSAPAARWSRSTTGWGPNTDSLMGSAATAPAATSHTTNAPGYLPTADSMSYFHDHHINDPKHDLDWLASPLLAESLARLPPTLEQFAADLQAHGGDRTAIAYARIDTSAAYANGIGKSVTEAQITYVRYHVLALTNKAICGPCVAAPRLERQASQRHALAATS